MLNYNLLLSKLYIDAITKALQYLFNNVLFIKIIFYVLKLITHSAV